MSPLADIFASSDFVVCGLKVLGYIFGGFLGVGLLTGLVALISVCCCSSCCSKSSPNDEDPPRKDQLMKEQATEEQSENEMKEDSQQSEAEESLQSTNAIDQQLI
jgi:cytochrome c556